MLYGFFFKVPYPRRAAGFCDDKLQLLQLARKKIGKFAVESTACLSNVIRPKFDSSNIPDLRATAERIAAAVKKVGLSSQRRWSVVLPQPTVRNLLVQFDDPPHSTPELEEAINWRVEKVTGIEVSQLRMSYQPASRDGLRYLVSVMVNEVLAEYEQLFKLLGWDVGLILPGPLAEMLLLPETADERLLISFYAEGFVAIAMKADDMVLLRTQETDEKEDDLYRMAAYYGERLLSSAAEAFVLGSPEECELSCRVFNEVCPSVQVYTPSQLPLLDQVEAADFRLLVAPAGAASLAF
ncbi:MAG: hypothetical protein RMM17_00890 [Acidobacteriota bacterium]|nr:hypothetical protein [Blastocatellia bacterium]MDW8411223.1 hypothetical protein [Acidobacteriota bacterium]